MPNKAIILGASGLIGSSLLDILLAAPEYDEVMVFVRRKLNVAHAKLKQLLVDFDYLSDYAADFDGNVVFSCLGTTRAQTPDLDIYHKIDHDYPVQMARIAKDKGITQFHLVSSIGASASSSHFYTKLKGETEDDVIKVGLQATFIYRPSLLTGRSGRRGMMETVFTIIMTAVDPLLFGGLKKYRSIAAKKVATAMYRQSLTNIEGVFIYPSDKIQELA